jgi:hypothetical protein
MDNKPILIATFRGKTKRALVGGRLLSVLDVDQAVRSPKALEVIWNAW